MSPREGLVAKQVEVIREGKAHTQTVYVRAGGKDPLKKEPKSGDVLKKWTEGRKTEDKTVNEPSAAQIRQTKIKQIDGHKVAQQSGADAIATKQLVDNWRGGASPKQLMQYKAAIGGSIGLNLDKDIKRIATHEASIGMESAAHYEKKLRELTANTQKDSKLTAAALGIAKASQSAHQGDIVTLYRGIHGDSANQIKDAIKSGGQVKIGMDGIASFTESREMARSFAKDGVVIQVKVPRSSIVMSHRAFKELSHEKEVVLATHGAMTVEHTAIEVRQ